MENPVDTNEIQSNVGTSSIEEAIKSLKEGKFVVVMDNEDRENEGDLIMPAEFATEESLAFMIRYCSGVICVAALKDRLKELELPLMVSENLEVRKCKFTITVDLNEGNTTGISAADRARTIRAIADKTVGANAFSRPGHIFPLLAMNGGVVSRAGHTESAVDLARLAGCTPVGYICEINDDNGRMMRRTQLEMFATKHGLHLITISDLIKHRFIHEVLICRSDISKNKALYTPHGKFMKHDYKSLIDDQQYEALVFGHVNTGDVLLHFVANGVDGSIHAQWAQKKIAEKGRGVLIYVPGYEELVKTSGELMAKQSIFGIGMQIMKDLKVQSVKILSIAAPSFDTNGFGIKVEGTETLSII